MKLLFISLGCDKNLVDSEMMMGLLRNRGYEFTDDEMQADVIVVNTCGFINDAKEESINTILNMAQYKEHNLKALVVAGCLAERYKNEIMEELPEISYCSSSMRTADSNQSVRMIEQIMLIQNYNQNYLKYRLTDMI